METGTNQAPMNVAVYVDYENIHKSLIRNQQNILRLGFFEKLRAWCKNNNKRVVQIKVYCNFDNKDLYDSHHQSMLQNYGVETIHTSNQGKNYADLKMSIDALTSMYLNKNIDEFFIVSNDKDMTPLLNAIRANKRNAYIITAGEDYNKTICEFADCHITLEEICNTTVEHMVIEDVEKKIWENIEAYVSENIEKCKNSGETYKDYALEYNSKKSSSYYCVYLYEFYNIIKQLFLSGKILFYKYKFKDCTQTAIIPASKKDECIKLGIFKESDIIDYDIDHLIGQEYRKYISL